VTYSCGIVLVVWHGHVTVTVHVVVVVQTPPLQVTVDVVPPLASFPEPKPPAA
jgi:hypothetical protein